MPLIRDKQNYWGLERNGGYVLLHVTVCIRINGFWHMNTIWAIRDETGSLHVVFFLSAYQAGMLKQPRSGSSPWPALLTVFNRWYAGNYQISSLNCQHSILYGLGQAMEGRGRSEEPTILSWPHKAVLHLSACGVYNAGAVALGGSLGGLSWP